jgi:SAM-dependent methyltransferase
MKTLAKRAIESVVYRIDPAYASYRARRDWNHAALHMPREVTATFDAQDWETYWESGRRQVGTLLALARRAGPLGSGLAVEIGCGLGRLTRPLAGHFERVIGVDIADEMLKIARRDAAAPNIAYELLKPGERLPVDDDAADLLLAWTVFRHVSRSAFEGYLDEARRVLRPGGSLLFEAQVRDRGPRFEPPPYDSFTEREYSPADLRACCSAQGFRAAAEQFGPSVTPGTQTLIVVWRK